jgi:NAD(P)H-dependent flavin oxidoreductase YrpB (nitropropane dioxygenase family)
LIIVPDGPLYALPFETIGPSADRRLLSSHVITYAPSGTVFALLSEKGSAAAALPLLAVATGSDGLVNAGAHASAQQPFGNINRDVFDYGQPDEAAVLLDAGLNAIVASGFEAGGHRGSFLRPAEDSLTGTFSLVPQIVDIVDVPVIAAGGIGDARGVVAALALGADGVQLGTAFLACEESGASRLHRQALLGRTAGHTALTRGFTGRLARGIHNRLMEELNRKGRGIALPIAARTRQKPVDCSGGGRPIGSSASMGRSKRQPLQVYRRVSLL